MRGEPTRSGRSASPSRPPKSAVCTEEADLAGRCLQVPKAIFGDRRLAHDEVQKEAVLERLVRDRPRFQTGQIQPARREALQRCDKAAGHMCRGEAQRALAAGWSLPWPRGLARLDDHEASPVAVVVLN